MYDNAPASATPVFWAMLSGVSGGKRMKVAEEFRDYIRHISKDLTQKQAEAIWMVWGLGWSQARTARELKVSASAIGQRIVRAREIVEAVNGFDSKMPGVEK